jgi:hypothetical protein
VARALGRSTDGEGTQDIRSPDTLEADALQVNTTFVPPAGAAFPGSPTAGELFWRTDTKILYRRNSINTVWEAVVAGAIANEKSGVVPKTSFISSGGIKKASVAFLTAYPTTSYSITHVVNAGGSSTNAAYVVSVRNKTVTGFDMYVHSGNINDLVAVEWFTRPIGE